MVQMKDGLNNKIFLVKFNVQQAHTFLPDIRFSYVTRPAKRALMGEMLILRKTALKKMLFFKKRYIIRNNIVVPYMKIYLISRSHWKGDLLKNITCVITIKTVSHKFKILLP